MTSPEGLRREEAPGMPFGPRRSLAGTGVAVDTCAEAPKPSAQESESTVAMTSPTIPSRAFDHPAAWTAADLGGKEAFAFDLADPHIAAFEAAVAGLRERGRTAFEDHDEPHRKRHLMRLWLMDWDGRPTVEGVRYHKGEGGITPQRDREPYYAKRNPAIDAANLRGTAL